MEISQSMLKYSSDEVILIFCAKVLNFFSPKFSSEKELELAEVELINFAKNCDLTSDEFLYALELAADGNLYSEPDEIGKSKKVQLFREIDRLKLGEVKSAYKFHKKTDKLHLEAKKEIKEITEKKPEISEEQKKAEKKKNFESLIEAIKKNEPCNHAFLFYDFVIKKGGLKSFVSSKQAQIILIRSKMISYLDRAEKSRNKALFNSFQIIEFRKYFDTGNLNPELAFDFEKLKNIAIIEVKNDLVYAYLKKNLWKYNLKKSNNENS